MDIERFFRETDGFLDDSGNYHPRIRRVRVCRVNFDDEEVSRSLPTRLATGFKRSFSVVEKISNNSVDIVRPHDFPQISLYDIYEGIIKGTKNRWASLHQEVLVSPYLNDVPSAMKIDPLISAPPTGGAPS